MSNVAKVCGQRCAISAIASSRDYLSCIRNRVTGTSLIHSHLPSTLNTAIVQSCFCFGFPSKIFTKIADHGRIFLLALEFVSIIEYVSGIFRFFLGFFVLCARSNIANQLPRTGCTRFRRISILQLHVGCGNALVQYHEWNPAFVEAFLEFYGGENGIVIALNNESCFGVSAC